MKKIFCSIITIGDELLIGQTIDTNSTWMAQRLNAIGVLVKRRLAVADDRQAILSALGAESREADIILITGGLGPTSDDITKSVLCEYFGAGLVVNEEALENVKRIFSSRGAAILEPNLQQAMVPDKCTAIPNKRGTAPGMWFQQEEKVFVSMPGVPHEMKGIMTDYVLPRLQEIFKMPAIIHKTLITVGMGESFVAERLKEFELQLPGHIRLAYLPGYALLKLRLSATGDNKEVLEEETARQFLIMKNMLADIAAATEDIGLEQVAGTLLKEKDKTLGTAESCTGGYIAHRITTVPGSSAWFRGSVVSYANELKIKMLKVNAGTIELHGAVSEETVREMAAGALNLLQTDYAIAVSGIMGPDGGTPEKPVGTVWIAVGDRNKTVTRQYHLRHDRERNIQMTATYALDMLRKFILES